MAAPPMASRPALSPFNGWMVTLAPSKQKKAIRPWTLMLWPTKFMLACAGGSALSESAPSDELSHAAKEMPLSPRATERQWLLARVRRMSFQSRTAHTQQDQLLE